MARMMRGVLALCALALAAATAEEQMPMLMSAGMDMANTPDTALLSSPVPLVLPPLPPALQEPSAALPRFQAQRNSPRVARSAAPRARVHRVPALAARRRAELRLEAAERALGQELQRYQAARRREAQVGLGVGGWMWLRVRRRR